MFFLVHLLSLNNTATALISYAVDMNVLLD